MESDHDKLESIKTSMRWSLAFGTWQEVVEIFRCNPEVQYFKLNSSGRTILDIAVLKGEVDVVRQMVGLIPPDNVNRVLRAETRRGNTPLHLAAALGTVAMCYCIAQKDPHLIGTRNHDGETALHIAVSKGNVYLVQQLVRLIPPDNVYEVLSAENKRGNTPLHLAVALGMDAMCSYIAERDPKLIGTRNHDGETALHIALSKAKVDLVRQLVGLIPSRNVYEVLSAGNKRGDALLHLAVALGMDAMCSYIAERDPKLIGTRNHDGETALHIVLSEAKVDLVRQLVGLIPPRNVYEVLSAGNKRGDTLLHLAVALGMDAMCSYITERDPKLTGTRNHDGETALHIALSEAKVDLVRQLVGLIPLDNVYEVLSAKDERGNTPLHLAAALGMVAMCIYIAKRDPHLIGTRNHDGETPLFLTVLNGETKAFLCLHKQSPKNAIAGCSYCRRSDGDTILHCAIFGEYFGLAYHIINLYKGLVDWKNEKGQTALHVLATKPSAFKSGSRLGIYDQIIYRSVFVGPLVEETLSKEDYEDDSEDKRSSKYPDNYRTCVNFFWLLMMIIKLTVFKLIVNLFLLPVNTIKVLGNFLGFLPLKCYGI